MENKTIIEIRDVQRKPVTLKTSGETKSVTEVTDARTGRKASTWDSEWTASWKIGDTVEVVFGQPKSWVDRTNVTHETWPITNPNAVKKAFTPRAAVGTGSSPLQTAWTIAAILLAPQFVGKKIDVKYVGELADVINKAMTPVAEPQIQVVTAAPAAPVTAAAPAAPVAAAPVAAPVAKDTINEADFVEDADKPF